MTKRTKLISPWPSGGVPTTSGGEQPAVESATTWPQQPPAAAPNNRNDAPDEETTAVNPWAVSSRTWDEGGGDEEPPDPVPGEPEDSVDSSYSMLSAQTEPELDAAPDPSEDQPAADYPVGYKRPPQHSQFKKGQSGNKNGRPRKPKSLEALFQRELDKTLRITEGGKELKLTKREAIAKRLVNKAISGDTKAIESLIKSERENPPIEPFQISEDDDAVLEKYLTRKFGLPVGDDMEGNL